MSEQEPNEEELRAAFEQQMKHIRVEDVVLQTIVTLINLGARRLGIAGSEEEAGERDPAQAQLAIEGARALLALVDGEQLGPVRDALSQLQMAFVREQGTGNGEQGTEPPAPEAEPEKPPSKLWTPPGT
jgi:hypothetical protein